MAKGRDKKGEGCSQASGKRMSNRKEKNESKKEEEPEAACWGTRRVKETNLQGPN